MVRPHPGAVRVSAAIVAAVILAAAYPAAPRALSSTIVISQVYGAGGNASAVYTHDYVELFNRGAAPVSIAGWSLQYASATGTGNLGATATQITELPNVTLAPGQYFLVQQAGGTTGAPLPGADHVDTSPIAMAAGAGKVALVSSTVPLGCNGGSTSCSAAALAAIVDLVGYGGANFFEGAAPAPALSAALAAFRGDLGCAETDQNGADFVAATPAPRTTASPSNPCTGPPALSIGNASVTEGDSATVTASFTVSLSAPAPAGGVTFDIATQDDTATAGSNDYVAMSLTAQTIPAGQQTYTFDVPVNGDIELEPNESFFVNLTNITGATPGDVQGTGSIANDDVAPPVFDVVISQVYGGGGNSGATLRNDFVELFNRGTTPVSLAGWTIQYTSPTGTGTWFATPLAGTIQPGRYFLVQQAAGAGGTVALPAPDATGTIALGAGAGKVALLATATPFAGACPAGTHVVDLVGYGNTSCVEAAPVGPTANATAALRKRGGCWDSNNNAADFVVSSPVPRNSATATRSCEYVTAPIHTIQGEGLTTPFSGLDVTTTGIVTALKSNGFFLQTADAAVDASPATSQGLFVFTGAAPVLAPGDEAIVRGTAGEFFNLTQVEATLPGDVTVVSSANPLPTPVPVTAALLNPAGAAAQLEVFEGMRLHAGALVSVAPTNEFGEIHTVLAGVARPMREPGIEASLPVPPDSVTGLPDCCIPRFDENRERLMLDTDGILGSAPVLVTSHVTLSNVTGPLDFSFGAYKVLPEIAPIRGADIAAVPVPVPAANEFTVAGYNIENFTSANDAQRRKAALAIRTILRYPDVIGHIEIANLATLQALASQVNADAAAAGDPNPAYEARLIPASPGATQNVGFLVKTSRVQINAVTQELAAEPFGTDLLHDRPPLVLHATVDPLGANPGEVIVVVNHLRSFIDVELLNATGARVRAKRTAQAESVAALLQRLQTDHPGTPVISVGDYNAYEFSDGYTDPIGILKGMPTPGNQLVVSDSPDLVNPNYRNLTDLLPAAERYSFIFEGTPQALDHVLVNEVAHSYLQRYAIARSNADFPESALAGYFGNPATPERHSDHDMPVAYFAFPGTPVVTLNGSAVTTVEAFTSFVDPGASAHDDKGTLRVATSGTVDVNTPGEYTLTYTASNVYATTSVTRTVRVVDTIGPAFGPLTVTPGTLSANNHTLVDIAVSYQVTDASGAVSCSVGVSSNEPINGNGDGNTAVDWQVVSLNQVRVRAERTGSGSGRVYYIDVTCTDASGNARTARGEVRVTR